MEASLRRSRLVWPNVLLLLTLLLHDLDNLRQGRDVEIPVIALGIMGDLLVVGSLVMAVRGHRLAAGMATLVGFAVALGFVLVHVIPDWGPLSQGYPDLGVDALSWIAALVPLAAGLVLGFSGLAVRRADGATSAA